MPRASIGLRSVVFGVTSDGGWSKLLLYILVPCFLMSDSVSSKPRGSDVRVHRYSSQEIYPSLNVHTVADMNGGSLLVLPGM